MDAKMAKEMEQDFRKMLQERLDEVKHEPPSTVKPILAGAWTGYRFANSDDFLHSPDTGVAEKTLVDIGVKMHTLTKERTFFKKMQRLYAERIKMVQETGEIEWAIGELLAYGTLVLEGQQVRVSGQAVERGTVCARHETVTVEK